jgi:integrase
MARGRLVGREPERVTFDDLVALIRADYVQKEHRTWERVEHSLKHLRPAFERVPALEISYDRVSRYITARLGEGAARGTVHHEIAAVSRMLKLAVLAGRLPLKPPLPTLKLDNVRKGFFSDEEVLRVLAQLPGWYAPPIEFAWRTGWRIGEVKGLTWSQVDFGAGTVRLEPGTTKNREGRLFPISASPALHALLQRQFERTLAWQRQYGQILPWVFWRNGMRLADHRDTWTSACKRAGLPGKLVHDLRRSAVRNLERAGVPRCAAMKLTGHKTESVYRRYAIVSEADLVDAVRRLDAFHAGTSTKLAQSKPPKGIVDRPTLGVDESTQTGSHAPTVGSEAVARAAARPATHPVDQAHWKL